MVRKPPPSPMHHRISPTAIMSLYSAIVVPLSVISGLWIPCILLCCIPWVQKQYVGALSRPQPLTAQDVVPALGDTVSRQVAD